MEAGGMLFSFINIPGWAIVYSSHNMGRMPLCAGLGARHTSKTGPCPGPAHSRKGAGQAHSCKGGGQVNNYKAGRLVF